MRRALEIVVQAFRLWWRELGLLTLFNLAWLALQVPIITGPPATAAMYVIARRVAGGEVLELRDGWRALRAMMGPAWRWAAVMGLAALVLAVNLWTYRQASGWLWVVLRAIWACIAVVVCAANLFYWPFWLAQSDRRLLLALRNSLLVYLKAPAFGLTLLLVAAALAAVSVLTTLPLAAGLMAWLSLIGVLAVEAELKAERGAPARLGRREA